MADVISIYSGQDPRELPFYTVGDVARYLSVPRSTLRAWSGAKTYVVGGRRRRMAPLFTPDARSKLLTFNNFVEAYILTSFTRQFQLPLPRVRKALAFVGGARPLLDHVFQTDGVGIFVEGVGCLVDASRGGQATIRAAVESSLQRVDFDATRRPVRFHPWLNAIDEPKVVSIDPYRAFGRPTVAGRAIKVDVVVDRIRAGESVDFVAHEYELPREVVEGVLRWGLDAGAR